MAKALGLAITNSKYCTLMQGQSKPKNCAIYTRISVDAGQGDDFDSVNAQFMACAEYIGAQFMHNWILVDALYEDRGYSGSSLDRPGVSALLRDIKHGLVDVVVVHRLDRLTRSIRDLQEIMALLKAHDVELISVTHKVDVTSEFGRLAVNMLTSFSEFERQLVGARVKEKRAETLRQGRWQGSSCPLGYVIRDGQLVEYPKESQIVREIFTRYANHESVSELYKDLNDRGIRTKQWYTRTGKPRGARPYDRNSVYVILNNRAYIGEVFFDNEWQQGGHQPIIDTGLWDRTQSLLEKRSRRGPSKPYDPLSSSFMLKGRVFGTDGRAMSPWRSSAYKSRCYTYYVPQRDIAEGAGASGLPRLSAHDLDHQVWLALVEQIENSDSLLARLPKTLTEDILFDKILVSGLLKNISRSTELYSPLLRKDMMLQVVERVIVGTDRIELIISPEGLLELICEMMSGLPELKLKYRRLFRAANGLG